MDSLEIACLLDRGEVQIELQAKKIVFVRNILNRSFLLF